MTAEGFLMAEHDHGSGGMNVENGRIKGPVQCHCKSGDRRRNNNPQHVILGLVPRIHFAAWKSGWKLPASQAGKQIFPTWVIPFNKVDLPIAWPALQ